ncbi:YjbA family protein [Thalassobacillus devorans]|uniref:YjbA family protein n=1 Tax=Thalassobacillus devorans TaxID=279813 RepID=UPI00048FC7F8|nr:YjbA family protein [Thalassobacillus devorans]
MLYLHDVWVNWFEGEENGYNVSPFHEWRKEDGIELLDQAPLLYITNDLYQFIENDLQDLPISLLESIHRRAYLRKNQERKSLDYAAIVTNGHSVLAFDTLGYTLPVRKSRLIPRQERLALEMIEGQKPNKYDWDSSLAKKEHHILSLSPEYMLGLTRKERQLKQLLMMALDQLQHTDNPEEIRYWLTEWEPSHYPMVKEYTIEQAWQKLYEGTTPGWSRAHEELCGKIIKGQPFFEKIWELENHKAEAGIKNQN